jgi:hypothetical protein
MRIVRLGFLICVLACGNQEPATSPPPPVTSHPATTSTAPAASASAAPVASTAPEPSATASAAPAAPSITQTLKQLVGSAKVIQVAWREKMDSNQAKTATIRSVATIKAIIDALGADEVPSGSLPAYMWTFTFRFEDAKENPLATVSLFASPTMADETKKYGRIDTADGRFSGLTVAKYDVLQKKLRPLGIKLP